MIIDSELFAIALKNIRTMGLRSYLTLLGIIIGIAAIVALASLGQGLNDAVSQQFESIGLDVIFVEPGSGEFISTAVSRTIKESDIKLIETVPGVEAAMGFYEGSGTAKFKNQDKAVFLIGIDPDKAQYLEKSGYLNLKKGRELSSNDRHAVLIEESFAKEGFDHEIGLKQKLEINGEEFTVVGILENSDVAFSGFGEINMVWTSKKTMQEIFDVENPVELAVKATSKDIVDDVAERIKRKLFQAHGEEDVTVLTSENLLEAVGAVIGIIQIVLIGLASISLLVGGIGIMNTMLMAVMERTKEIGIMKAIGATNARVLSLFLAEAGLLGFIGAGIGTLIGLLIAFGVSLVSSQLGFALPFGLNIFVIIGAMAFGMIVGMVSGFVPARRAALLEPVEALRHGM